MAKFGAVVRETLGTAVYNEIRNAILDGDFFPGDTVKIKQIAEEMGVSATPVRDALLQLVMERVLVMPSSREIRVPQMSRKEFQEIRTLRIMLEGYAAEEAAKCVTQTDIKELEDINAKIDKAFERGKPKLALSQNRAFHACLYSIAGMSILEDVLDRLWLRMAPLIASWAEAADVHDFTHFHLSVMDALKRGDGEAARKAIAEDILTGGEKIETINLQGAWAPDA